jgi:hypothetical protein
MTITQSLPAGAVLSCPKTGKTSWPNIKRAVLVTAQLIALMFLMVGARLAQLPLSDDAYVTSATAQYALPAGLTAANISGANLRLFISAITQSGSLDVHLVSGSWSENTITYKNAASAGGRLRVIHAGCLSLRC